MSFGNIFFDKKEVKGCWLLNGFCYLIEVFFWNKKGKKNVKGRERELFEVLCVGDINIYGCLVLGVIKVLYFLSEEGISYLEFYLF